MEGNPMADNPKSLASLADELEAMAKKPQYYPRSPAVLMAAAAALRAPTIAVTDAEAADADSVEYANKVQSNLSRPDAFVWMVARNAYLAGRAALSTPSPTIAAQHVVCKCENCKRRDDEIWCNPNH